MMKILIVLSLIVLSHWCQELEASTQVVVNCRCDETGEKGDKDYPEKQGKDNSSGIAEEKGSRELKGEPGVCPSSCFDVEGKVLKLQQNLQALVECVGSCIHGRCDKVNNTFVCLCETGYTGRFCKEFSCDDQPCGRNSQCTGWNQCTCYDGYQLVDDQCQAVFSNCNHVYQSGITTSGIYYMNISGINKPTQVYCELNNNGGNWLVIQRRVNGNVSFDRDWADYQAGFGELNGDFWLGLDLMHAITSTGSYQLRVDLEDWNKKTAYAAYSNFSVGNSQSNYTLTVNGYSGTAGDSMDHSDNRPFTTRDRDNDAVPSFNCGVYERSGWWHGTCTNANLNGQYYNSNVKNRTGIYWSRWRYTLDSMKQADMKIKMN